MFELISEEKLNVCPLVNLPTLVDTLTALTYKSDLKNSGISE